MSCVNSANDPITSVNMSDCVRWTCLFCLTFPMSALLSPFIYLFFVILCLSVWLSFSFVLISVILRLTVSFFFCLYVSLSLFLSLSLSLSLSHTHTHTHAWRNIIVVFRLSIWGRDSFPFVPFQCERWNEWVKFIRVSKIMDFKKHEKMEHSVGTRVIPLFPR